MSLRGRAAEAATAVLGLGPVAAVGRRRWADRVRIIDYHGIDDVRAFEAQVAFLAQHYRVVSEGQVRAAMTDGAPLPELAVWLTFDDGDPSIVRGGLDVLARHGLTATLYVCPGLIEAREPPWWELIYAAGRGGAGAVVDGDPLIGGQLVQRLKVIPDAERRAVVDELRPVALDHLDREALTLSVAELDRWVDAGNEVGNHTWDHPCLHNCDDAEQAEQITRAHEWLVRYRPAASPSFAYPNGDHTPHAESVLEGLGVEAALLSDHRLADLHGSRQRISRLRLDASAPVSRTRAVVSGVHSAAYEIALGLHLTGPSWADR